MHSHFGSMRGRTKYFERGRAGSAIHFGFTYVLLRTPRT